MPMNSGSRHGGAKPVAGSDATLRTVALADPTDAPVKSTGLVMIKGTGVPARMRVSTCTSIVCPGFNTGMLYVTVLPVTTSEPPVALTEVLIISSWLGKLSTKLTLLIGSVCGLVIEIVQRTSS